MGAITNESQLTGADIGRIDLFPIFSVIDLPADLPDELVSSLAEVKVRGRRLGLRRLSEDEVERVPRRGGGPGRAKGGGADPGGGDGKPRERPSGPKDKKKHRKGPGAPKGKKPKRSPSKPPWFR